MNKIERITLLAFFLLSKLLTAQQNNLAADYGFSCGSGFYQLIDNQLQSLSIDGQGTAQWKPIRPPFDRPLSAIAYCLDDDFMYSIDTLTHELIRIYQSGAVQPLGVPRHVSTKALLETQLTIGEIGQGIFCAYTPQENKFYWIDLATNTFVTTETGINSQLTNLAYCSTRQLFCSVDAKARFYFWDPISKKPFAGTQMMNLPSTKAGEVSHLWVTENERFFATRKNGRAFYELNEQSGMPYNYANLLLKRGGDETSCAAAPPPVLLEEEVLEFRLEAPKKDRIRLSWTGVHEYTTARYYIEHSLDHKKWKEVGEKPSNGPNTYQNPYGALSPYQEGKTNFYRLKKVSKYGRKLGYSRTIMSGEWSTMPSILVSPKIAMANAALAVCVKNHQNTILNLSLWDGYGQLIYEKEQPILCSEITLNLELTNCFVGWHEVRIQTAVGVQREWIWVQQ
ncbi:DUF6923 family protein [Aureispira anguillae]|uniref:DUF6923 domain-containing protein n=1 Tax=Aureispira anguillae TaxID=2864201 RepID=A0A916DUF3_9BACT|nr:hypothetical protein [Aureispira anguillae]BDS12642.1 hypothetical protein AsAng_0033660 [Aureispira anguillae]